MASSISTAACGPPTPVISQRSGMTLRFVLLSSRRCGRWPQLESSVRRGSCEQSLLSILSLPARPAVRGLYWLANTDPPVRPHAERILSDANEVYIKAVLEKRGLAVSSRACMLNFAGAGLAHRQAT